MRRVGFYRGGVLGVCLVAGVVCSLGVVGWYFVGQEPVQREITRSRLLGGALRELGVSRSATWSPNAAAGLLAITSTHEARDGLVADGHLYVATSGGLLVFSERGRYEKTLTWLEGLGSSDLTAMAQLGSHVVCGTSDGSLVMLGADKPDRVSLQQASEAGSAPRAAITELVSQGKLLYAGTYGAGLVVWDGQRAAHVTTSKEGDSLREVTALALDDGRLAVGTSEGLVFLRQGERLVRVLALGEEGTRARRDRITALAWDGALLWVGTPQGLLRVDAERRTTVVRPSTSITSLLSTAGRLYIGTIDEGVIVLDASREERRLCGRERIVRVRLLGARPVAFTTRGTFDLASAAALPLTESPPRSLASPYVTALAAHQGEVWVGTRDRGIDVLDSDGHLLRHALAEGSDPPYVHDLVFHHDVALAATARGVIPLDLRGHPQGRRNPALRGEIEDTTTLLSTVAYATHRGVIVVDGDGVESRISVEDGLPTSEVYAVAFGQGGRLYAGTSAGLAVLSPDFSVDSGQAPNRSWITALATSSDGVYAGTRDHGAYLVGEDGRVTELTVDLGPFGVAPGSIWVDADRVFVGTVGRGLLVYERSLKRWRTTVDSLGSRTVTRVLGTADTVWIGTDQGLLRVPRAAVETLLSPTPQS
jgi:ligand-binding sensor domain-containing protein